MKFMLLVKSKGVECGQAGTEPSPEAIEKMTRFNEELQRAGAMICVDGLQASADAARVTIEAGKAPLVSDGPFPESKELVGGFWLIRARDRAEAIAWARRAPMPRDCVIEVRGLQDVEVFRRFSTTLDAGEADATARAATRPVPAEGRR